MKKAKTTTKKSASAKKTKSPAKARSTAQKKTAPKKAAAKKAQPKAFAKAAILPERATLTETLFRPVCITERKKLGSFMSEQEADDITKAHERDFPDHVTDLEEKD